MSQILEGIVVLRDDEHFVGQPELLVLLIPSVEEIDVAVIEGEHNGKLHLIRSHRPEAVGDRRWAHAKVVLTPLHPRVVQRERGTCCHGTQDTTQLSGAGC